MEAHKYDPELIQQVHQAAKSRSFEEMCDLVVDTAKKLVLADNGRLRFVDYSEKRLVPGAIRGALAEKLEMAVRDFGECIVGRAAAQRKSQFVLDVQSDPDFRAFKVKVEKRSKQDADWKDYHDATLKRLGSEIAVPVLAGQDLLGVLSVNAFTQGAFRPEAERLLSEFASEVAVGFLIRRAVILEELHRIEQEMISVFALQQVAEHIADGIRRMVQGSIPNIFLYYEDSGEREKSPFRFLASAGASDEEKKLGSFEPRSIPRHDTDGRGVEAIRKWKQGQDAFVVVEDVQSDPRGSPTALKNKVQTTACLPLVFKGTVLGVLYLHFKKRHFFTIEEKRVLEMFAIPAAIAIRNATVLPSYIELYGNALSDELKRLTSSNGMTGGSDSLNERIHRKLLEIFDNLGNSRGEQEIAECILAGVKAFCGNEYFSLPKRFSNMLGQFQKHEGVLYAIPYYRDHFVHAFHVFCLGYLILNHWWKPEVRFLCPANAKDEEQTLKRWFIASIQHDIAYPVEMAKLWVPRFPRDVLDLDIDIRSTFDWCGILTREENIRHIEKLAEAFAAPLENVNDSQKASDTKIAFKRWFCEQLLEKQDHGALASLTLASLEVPQSDLPYSYGAALDVLLHNYSMNRDIAIGQLAFGYYPLAFLLCFCDTVQEWGRAEGTRVDGFWKSVDTSVRFAGLQVSSQHTAVVLSYAIEQRCKQKIGGFLTLGPTGVQREMNREKEDVRAHIAETVEDLRNAWRRGAIHHSFSIKACDEEEEEEKEFCSVAVI